MEAAMQEGKVILLDYYDGAYGPTIRIDVQSVGTLTRIKDFFLQLADSTIDKINLTEIEGVRTIGLNQFILKWVPDNQESKKRLILVSNAKANVIFEWTMSSKSWKRT